MKRSHFTWLQVVTHIGCWTPLVLLAWRYFTNRLTANPIQTLTQRTGIDAMVLLVLSLACTPLNTLFGFRQVLTVRRALGIYAFLYATLHVLIFVGLDFQFDWFSLQDAVLGKPFIWIGAAAFLILLLLTLTAFKWWMKRLRKNWKRLQQLVYLAGGLVIAHYALAVKGNVLRLEGDIIGPVSYGVLVLLLLVLRIPPIRRGLSNTRILLNHRLVELFNHIALPHFIVNIASQVWKKTGKLGQIAPKLARFLPLMKK